MENVNGEPAARDSSAAEKTYYGSFFHPSEEPSVVRARQRAFLAEHMAMAEELTALPDVDWGAELKRPDVDQSIWKQPVVATWGENKFCTDVGRSDLCVGAVAALALSRVALNPITVADPKDTWFVTLTDIQADEQLGRRPRHAAIAVAQYGIQIEDDGCYTAKELREAVRRSGYLTAMYSTASHGKSQELVSSSDFTNWVTAHNRDSQQIGGHTRPTAGRWRSF